MFLIKNVEFPSTLIYCVYFCGRMFATVNANKKAWAGLVLLTVISAYWGKK